MTREDRGKIREDGKEGVKAGPEARFETGRELKEAEGGRRREEGRREEGRSTRTSAIVPARCGCNCSDLLHVLITKLFLLPTMAELFRNHSTLWNLFIMPQHLAPTASHGDLQF